MKIFLKCVGLLMVGLFVAAIGYPFLHEFGHSIIAVLVGAKVVDFNLLPLPYVVLDVRGINAKMQVMIGFGGIIFPLLLTAFIKAKNFWLWYSTLLVKGISLYAVVISLVSTMLHICGISLDNEDIVKMLKLFPNSRWMCIVVLVLIFVCGIVAIKKEKPFIRCLNHFGVTD